MAYSGSNSCSVLSSWSGDLTVANDYNVTLMWVERLAPQDKKGYQKWLEGFVHDIEGKPFYVSKNRPFSLKISV